MADPITLDEQIAYQRNVVEITEARARVFAISSFSLDGARAILASLERLQRVENFAEQAYTAGWSNGYAQAKGLEPDMTFEEWRATLDDVKDLKT